MANNTYFAANITSYSSSPVPRWFQIITAVSYTLIFTTTVISYSLIIKAIRKYRNELEGSFYSYLISIGIAEITYTACSGTYNALCDFLGYCPGPQTLGSVLEGLSQIGWGVEISTDLVIAIDRMLAICFYHIYKRYFCGRLSYILIALTWLSGIVYASPLYTTTVKMFYDPTKASISFDFTNPFLFTLSGIYTVFDLSIMSVCALLYIIMIVTLWRRRMKTHTLSDSRRKVKAQRSLAIQGALHFSMIAINDILTKGGIRIQTSMWGTLMITLYFMCIPVANVALVLYLNATLRKCVLCILCKKPFAASVVPSKSPQLTPAGRQGQASTTAPAVAIEMVPID